MKKRIRISSYSLVLLLIPSFAQMACSTQRFNPLEMMKSKGVNNRSEKAADSPMEQDERSQAARKTRASNSQAAIKWDRDIVYDSKFGENLKLDLAYPVDLPVEGQLRPAVIYVHGGGFVRGNRQGYSNEIEQAASRGFVAITVDYRLADGRDSHRFPAAVNDVGTAVRWLKANAGQYHVDPDRIGITGGSAGGNLALMVGLAPEVADRDAGRSYSEYDSSVKAVVNYCGPTDYLEMVKARRKADPLHIKKYLKGKSVRQLKASAKKASPVYYLDKDDPPVLTLHGDIDTVVPYANAKKLDKAMKEAGLNHQLIELTGADHPGLSKIRYRDRIAEETLNFFSKHLQ